MTIRETGEPGPVLEAGRREALFDDLDRRRVDAALEAFYRAHIMSVYHSPKGQAEYLTGQKLHDGMRSWRPAIEAAVAALGPVSTEDIEAEASRSVLGAVREGVEGLPATRIGYDTVHRAAVLALLDTLTEPSDAE